MIQFAIRIAVFGFALTLPIMSAETVVAQGRPAGVATDFVELREVSETVPVFAQVVAKHESDVAVRVGGVVTEVPVSVGDVVEAGDVLAVLDRELLEIELRRADAAQAEAQAGVEVAEAGLTLAISGFKRVEGLRDTNAFSQGTFEDRQGAVARARGVMAQAEARLLNAGAARARASYDLARSEVTAPFGGTVMEVRVDQGEFVQPGAAVARILDTGDIEVEANIPSHYIGALTVGQDIAAEGEGIGPLSLIVRAVLPTEFSATRTRPVRFQTTLGDDAGPIAIGQSVTVSIPVTAPRQVLLVPKDAVVQARGAWNVYVHQDGKAAPRTITIGASFGPAFEVLTGLAHGDEVVVRGNERLRPMQDIAPTPVRDAPAGSADGAARSSPGKPDGDGDAARAQAAVAE